MGIFSRLSDIVASSFHSLLDKVENPEWMVGQIIREMEHGLAEARRYAATAIAVERRIGRELEHHREETERWRTRAREALAAGREDLARRALFRKKEHADQVRNLEPQQDAAAQTGASVRTSVRALEARLAEARGKQRSILARQRAAQVRLQLQRAVGSGLFDGGAPGDKFDRLENKLHELEDELVAQAEFHDLDNDLEEQFTGLQATKEIEEELRALQQEVIVAKP